MSSWPSHLSDPASSPHPSRRDYEYSLHVDPEARSAFGSLFNPTNRTWHLPHFKVPLYYAGLRPGETVHLRWGGQCRLCMRQP